MSELSRRLGALPDHKRTLLEQALLARRRAASQAITKRPDAGPAPLSASQQRLWFLDRLAPGASTYNAIVAMWVQGELDIDLLEEAVHASIARHEITRTVITVEHDEPVQHALPDWIFVVRRLIAEGITPEQRRAHAVQLATDAARLPYDLARDLMLRTAVVSVEPDLWLVAFCEHHIAFDGWSDEILFAEIDEYYNARRAGRRAPERAPLLVQFADFAVWQQRRLRSDELAPHVEYWTRTLTGVPAVLELPLDHPRPERQSFAGQHLTIDFAHAEGVRKLRRRLGGTDFMLLVAAWAATIYRWSGQTDIVLSTPMANRNRVELEPLIGFFSNTVPVRVRVDGAQPFAELVRATTETVLGAFDHQDLPFERIVDAVAPQRDPRINPLSQVNVRVQSGPMPQLHLDGAEVELIHIDISFARFDMAVELQLRADRIGGYLEYNEALFDEATARAVMARLDMLIGAVVEDPYRPIWDLPQPESARRPRRRRQSAPP